MKLLNLLDPFKRNREAQRANDWRFGCLTAVAVRMFPDQPQIGLSERERQERLESSEAFRAGWLYGLDMPLAFSLPDVIPPLQDAQSCPTKSPA